MEHLLPTDKWVGSDVMPLLKSKLNLAHQSHAFHVLVLSLKFQAAKFGIKGSSFLLSIFLIQFSTYGLAKHQRMAQVIGSWLWIVSSLAIAVIWGVNLQLEDVCLPLSPLYDSIVKIKIK